MCGWVTIHDGYDGKNGVDGRIDTTFIPINYTDEVDSLFTVRKLHSNAFLFKWTHTFHDVLDNWEDVVKFEMAIEYYQTRDDMFRSENDSTVWFGYDYGITTRGEYLAGRNHWEYLFTGVPLHRYAVVAIRAWDISGNHSVWMRSISSNYMNWIIILMMRVFITILGWQRL